MSVYSILPATPEMVLDLHNELENDSVVALDAFGSGEFNAPTGNESSNEIEVTAQIIVKNNDIDGIRSLMWRCHPRFNNKLMVDAKTPFRAKNIVWEYGVIAWRAGNGWPLYEIPCPRKAGDSPSHKIQMEFGGKTFGPCSTPASGLGVHQTQVFSLVDDNRYIDNTGYYDVIVTSYSLK